MMKIVVLGATALFLAASPIAHAQTPSPLIPERLNAADRNTLMDLRIDLAKAALQLTPDQEKYWPAVESAIGTGAEDRRAPSCKRLGNSRSTANQALSKSCAIVTPSPFCNDARKHWLNDQSIWILADAWRHSVKRLVPNRDSAWWPSQSLYSTI